MKILSWNARGLGSSEWRSIVRQVIQLQKIDAALIQESKINLGEDRVVKEIWGDKFIKWASLKAVGNSGGILFFGVFCSLGYPYSLLQGAMGG